ncbi:MAG: tetratricopeptide repeat protein, partial [Planctomycetes bacterium]|nr:tetratricopeptide repeat protein [Planctomycetota bacterium]
MRRRVVLLIAVACSLGVGAALAWLRPWARRGPGPWPEDPLAAQVLAAYRAGSEPVPLKIVYPPDGAVFPPEIVAPTFRWEDRYSDADAWVIAVQLRGARGTLSAVADQKQWVPTDEQWEAIKRSSVEAPARVTVVGVQRATPGEVRSAASISLHTSADEVGAPLFYREVHLPFIEAVKDPSKIRWRFGSVASKTQPPIVLQGLPVCGNCHSFSADGGVLGMDVDYANDKGSYAISPVAPSMVLDKEKIITWSDYRREDGELTFGLLSQVSPDGRFVVSTVKDRSVFVPKPDLEFSQLFFPVKGILGVHTRATGDFAALPGADDRRFVQSNAMWSPDGQWLVFARAEALALKHITHNNALLTEEECQEFLKDGKPFRFDLYRIPFHGGKGGKAEPLAGASHNGLSNYFPKYSPDGRWIVFCRAQNYMLLQPDSALYIVPAQGGEARRLACNLPCMNSWHSWSPNGRWLVFSSKANGPYTQLFLTHMDAEGNSSPPVLLEKFTAPDRAANIPEFVHSRPDAIQAIAERFVDDHSFARAGDECLKVGDLDGAARAYTESLRLNPKNTDALCNFGVVLIRQKRFAEAHAHLAKAIEIQPSDPIAQRNLGDVLVHLGRRADAMAAYRKALQLDPKQTLARTNLGGLLLMAGDLDEAVAEFTEGVRQTPDEPFVHFCLARALDRQKKEEQAIRSYRRAVELKADFLDALGALARLLAAARDPALRNGAEAVAHAQKACELTRNQAPEFLDILAAAQAQAGAFPDAVATARKALTLAEDARKHALA